MKLVIRMMAAIFLAGTLLSSCAMTPQEPPGQTCAMYKD